MLPIKLSYNQEVRRVSVPVQGAKITYDSLQTIAGTLFPELRGKRLSLFWRDDENDIVTCSTDDEVNEAIRVMGAENKTKCTFQVAVVDEAARVDAFDGDDDEIGGDRGIPSSDEVHEHVTCDGCGMHPLVGARFKCTVREDFDLCEACEAATEQPYPMIKIYDPSHKPELIMVALREEDENARREKKCRRRERKHLRREREFARCQRQEATGSDGGNAPQTATPEDGPFRRPHPHFGRNLFGHPFGRHPGGPPHGPPQGPPHAFPHGPSHGPPQGPPYAFLTREFPQGPHPHAFPHGPHPYAHRMRHGPPGFGFFGRGPFGPPRGGCPFGPRSACPEQRSGESQPPCGDFEPFLQQFMNADMLGGLVDAHREDAEALVAKMKEMNHPFANCAEAVVKGITDCFPRRSEGESDASASSAASSVSTVSESDVQPKLSEEEMLEMQLVDAAIRDSSVDISVEAVSTQAASPVVVETVVEPAVPETTHRGEIIIDEPSWEDAAELTESRAEPAVATGAESRWSRELSALREMGFTDLSKLIPLLSTHCPNPETMTVQTRMECLQYVVMTLLSQSGAFNGV